MNLVSYLKDIYGYDTPIFLKDIRIGGKSKAAIKEEFYRAVKRGDVERKSHGIYFLRSTKEFGSGVGFRDIVEKRFIYSDNVSEDFKGLFVEGYYSGMTFLNKIGISEQVPAVLEITTNKTRSNKRLYKVGNSYAIIRKARTEINFQNWKLLQFLDMFHFISMEEVIKNKQLIRKYISDNKLSRYQLSLYAKLYEPETFKKLLEGGILDAFI